MEMSTRPLNFINQISDMMECFVSIVSNSMEKHERKHEQEMKTNTSVLKIEKTSDIIEFRKLQMDERQFFIPFDFLELQKNQNCDNFINFQMYETLIDWLISIHQSFKMSDYALYLSINIIDQCLSKMIVPRNSLYLLGATAVLVVSKFFEDIPICVQHIVYITNKTYTSRDVVNMERIILKVIDYKILRVVHGDFLHFFEKRMQFSRKERHLTMFFVNYAIQTYALRRYPPSIIVSSAIYLSMAYFRNYSQITWLKQHTQVDINIINVCAREIDDIIPHEKPEKLFGICEKFDDVKYSEVTECVFSRPAFYDAY